MRAFVGLAVPDGLIAPLTRVQSAVAVGRPVAEDNLHVTLAFLGDTDEAALAELHEALEGRRLTRCTLIADGLATYGGSSPKLLAMDLQAEPMLLELQRNVARAVASVGLTLERRRFRPHITLARFGSGLRPDGQARLSRALADLVVPPIPATEGRILRLYRSHLSANGADYEVLAEYFLI